MSGTQSVRCAVAALVLVAAVAAQGGVIEDGAQAGGNQWYVAGGCASRSGVAETEPVSGDLALAWHFDAPGVIEGEPLVWEDVVVLAVRPRAVQRRLVVIRLLDGEARVAAKSFKTKLPLEPVLWRDVIIARTGPKQLEAFRVGRAILNRRWKYRAKAELSAPLVYRDEVYVREGGKLCRLAQRSGKVVWSAKGKFVGSLALRGEHVYAVEHASGGKVQLVWLDRAEGKRGGQAVVGAQSGAAASDPGGRPWISVHDRSVVVLHAAPMPLADESSVNAAVVPREVLARGGVICGEGLPMNLASPCAGAGDHWIGFVQEPVAGNQLVQMIRDERQGLAGMILADRAHHAQWLRGDPAPSRSQETVFVGGRSFDVKTGRIEWEGPEEVVMRTVPARETVLVVTSEKRLEAWRSTGTAAASLRDGFAWRDVGDEGCIVLLDGSVVFGPIVRDGSRLTRGDSGKSRKVEEWSLAEDVALAVDGASRITFARDAASARRAASVLAHYRGGLAYAELAEEACDAADQALIERLIGEAEARGGFCESLTKAERRLASLQRRPRRIDAALVASVGAGEAAVAGVPAEVRWSLIASLGDGVAPGLRFDLLRDLLEETPGHAAALALARTLLPEGMRDVPVADPVGMLDLAEAARQAEVRFVVPPRPDQGDLSYAQRELGSALYTWRKDLVGLESSQLLVLSPLAAPGSIARCLSVGELVCDTLEALFPGTARHEKRYALKLHLYETQEEYTKESVKGMSGFGGPRPGSLEWTAGHYSQRQNISRIFLPDSPEAFARVMNTYAHELVHHWLAERCPLYSRSEAQRRSVMTPGYWVVEGFATFIEEGRLDLRSRRFEPFNPRCRSLDTVASAGDQIIPWKILFGVNQAQFASIKNTPELQIPLHWHLGRAQRTMPKRMFYEQSAAACHFLFHAAEGLYRPQLREYLRLHYTGRTTPNTLPDLVSMSPEALGRRITAFAKETVGPK